MIDSVGSHRLRSRPLLCGYYGEHNLGDDALLHTVLQQLPSGCKPLVTAADQQQVQQLFAVSTCDRRSLPAALLALNRCDALVFGGGSLLQDSTSFGSLIYYGALISEARLQGKPVLLWGQGLGPLRRRRSRALVRILLSQVQQASWRDGESSRLAIELGRPAGDPIGTDPVWSFPPQPWRGSGGPIVLAWRPTPLLQGRAWLPLLEALASLAISQQRELLWLPFHRGQDRGLLSRLHSEGLMPEGLAERSRELDVSTPQEAMEVAAGAGLLLAMRLHALILGSLAGAPCAALSYDPKVAAAAAGLGCPCVDLAMPTEAPALLASWLAQLDRPADPMAIQKQVAAAGCHQRVLAGLL